MRHYLNGHMIRAMDYNDIYWKADPCQSERSHRSRSRCAKAKARRQGFDSRTIIAYESRCVLEVDGRGVREYGWHHGDAERIRRAVARDAC